MRNFYYRAGRLFCESVALEAVARRFHTPTYVYSARGILGNFRRLKRDLTAISNLVCYSVKANSNLSILSLLGRAGAGFDIVSGGELARLEKAGARPDRVVYSGVGKTVEEVDRAIRAGILMFNVESAGELELVEARARHLRRRAPIALRVNPDVRAETHPYVSTGRVIHKFGVPRAEALALYPRAAASKNLTVRGIACHIGSQILSAAPFLRALGEILEIADALGEEGIRIEFVDLGGGFGIRYRNEPPLDVPRLAAKLVARMRATPYTLILEPGRALVAEAGVLLARVLYVKDSGRKRFIVVDAGMNDLLRPALYGAYHEIVPLIRSSRKVRVDVVGPLCETGDFLARDRVLPEVRPGDLVAVMTVGAYGFAQASNYNSRPRPAEVLVRGRRATLARARETVKDLMAGEVV
ncbi:MAG: diaminopimelate decarboxylase [Acidobacteria bacterium]|nr:MAG: diaminopimelate decarboxylase [Acidobacteriota bacterium]